MESDNRGDTLCPHASAAIALDKLKTTCLCNTHLPLAFPIIHFALIYIRRVDLAPATHSNLCMLLPDVNFPWGAVLAGCAAHLAD